MSRIAVFTLQGPGNYGNRLQNYAVEKILNERFDLVHSIVPTNHVVLKPLQIRLGIVKDLFTGNHWKRMEARRKLVFLDFDRRYLHLKYARLKRLYQLNKYYDCFVTGSDQVWNPAFDPKGIFSLPFADKCFCISPSIGVDVLSGKDARRFKRDLPRFQYLSSREESGKRILEELTGRRVERLIDPVMYVDVSEWKKIERKPSGFNMENYIFCYTLGLTEIEKTDIAKQVRKRFNCEICRIYDERHENTVIAGPEGFVWLVHYSRFVLPASYHASVFSILFHKDFLICKRSGGDHMNTRFETLLSVFDIKNKLYSDGEKVEIPETDYNHVEDILKKERRRMKDYLTRCFG